MITILGDVTLPMTQPYPLAHCRPRRANPKTRVRRWWGLATLVLGLSLCLALPARAQEVKTIEPSGQWQGQHGVLSLMLTGDALSFCYSAVFGATGHLCDGVGVAGLEKDREYHYLDDQGRVAFIVTEQGVTMKTVEGVPSFCGANWPGDEFTRDGYKPVQRCRVAEPKIHFHVAEPAPPEPRRAYVLKGDRVEVVPACFEGGDAWVLARYKGAKATTVGLLKKDALECREENRP
jgi:hypothetical protein